MFNSYFLFRLFSIFDVVNRQRTSSDLGLFARKLASILNTEVPIVGSDMFDFYTEAV
jgi:hypothetical protein